MIADEQSPGAVIVLRRKVSERLFGGFRLQGLLTLLTAFLLVRLAGQAIGVVDDPSLSIGGTALLLLVLAAPTAVGASGWARADGTGVSWRYYKRRQVSWDEIRELTLGRKGVGITAVRLTVEIRTDRHRLRVTPAQPTTMFGRSPFARELLELAAAHGVSTRDEWPRRG